MAVAPGGVLDLAGVTSLRRSSLSLADTAWVDTSSMVDVRGSSITLQRGAWLDLTNVVMADGASFTVSGGSQLVLPGLTNYVAGPEADRTFRAEGAGSLLSLPSLTNAVGGTHQWDWYWLNVGAVNGGRIELGSLQTILDGQIRLSAAGSNSVVNMTGFETLHVGGSGVLSIAAQQGGLMDLHRVESISGSSCLIAADGAGSVIDLSRLSGFSTPLGASELKAINGGAVLLPGEVFLLVNVAVNIEGNTVLPPGSTAGASISLYAETGNSYWVEWRDTRQADSPWQLFARVAQTNDWQVISGPPESWQAFRVSPFVAEPPVVDLLRIGPQTGQVVLYARTNQVLRLETAGRLDAPPASWSVWQTVPDMTNSFRIFAPAALDDPVRFIRAAVE